MLNNLDETIGFYEREYYFLSNFSSFQVMWKGRLWQTSEHAYQASKFFDVDENIIEEIFMARSAHDSKKIAKKYKEKHNSNFEKEKILIMEDICRHKLEQHEFIEQKLLESGDKFLIEDSHKDSFWGWGENKDGRNELGKIWMRLREELKLKTSN